MREDKGKDKGEGKDTGKENGYRLLAYLADELGLDPQVVHFFPRRNEHRRCSTHRLRRSSQIHGSHHLQHSIFTAVIMYSSKT